MELFTVQNLTFSYPGQEPALWDISLSVGEGELLLVTGDSGSGKTTFLKQLKPQLTPHGQQSGDILYMGRSIGEMDAKQTAQGIGYVFQNPEHQIVTDKVWHELAFGLENQQLSQTDMDLRIGEVASYFGIQDWLYKKVEELSGGQKQILNLAAILTMNPRVILLDEPTGQLDPIASRNFLEMVYRIKEELGITIIMVEHHVDEVYRMADLVAVLHQGRLLHWGRPREVADFLCQRGLESLLPVIPRIYHYEKEKGMGAENGEKLPPITLQEGRKWLSNRIPGNGHKTFSDIAVSKDKFVIKQKQVVKIREVYYRYDRRAKDILKHLYCTVYEGECFGILGGNGVGKTTLLKLLGDYIKPYSGKVMVTKKTAYLPQNPQSMFSCDSVAQEVEGVPNELLSMFRMEHLLDRHPYDLSGGEQQRLALLILLAGEPELLLLDEPTKGMDEQCKQVLGEILRNLKKQGKTIIVVSHDVEFAARYTNRCGLLFDGRLTGVTETKQFFLQNQYYTTVARRLTRGIMENIVLEEEVMENV